jgi:hypothetical protein
MSPLGAKVLAALLTFAPPAAHDANPWRDASAAVAQKRYEGIAEAIAGECSDWRCASLLIAIGVGESGLAADADLGPCYRVGRFKTRCDRGRAASVWQVHAYGEDADGRITVARLFNDRALAARIVRRIAFGSLKQCAHLPARERLANLGGGKCAPSKSASARWDLWQRVLVWKPALKD